MTLKQMIDAYKRSVKNLCYSESPEDHATRYRTMVKNKAQMVNALLELETDIYFDIEEADLLLLRQFGVIDEEKVG